MTTTTVSATERTPRQNSPSAPCRLRGRVCWFDSAKGFGFLTPESGTRPVFVEYSAIQTDGYKTLHPGQSVDYTVVTTTRGPEAVQVYPCPPKRSRPTRSRYQDPAAATAGKPALTVMRSA